MGTVRNLSVRVPWHDQAWNGHVCSDPLANSSCLALKIIAERRNDQFEATVAGESFDKLQSDQVPPCMRTSGTFLSPRPHSFHSVMSYSKWSRDHRHIQPRLVHVPAWGALTIPYRWMLKESGFSIAQDLGLECGQQFEPPQPTWLARTSWVQGVTNQTGLLEAFSKPLIEEESIVLFYATRTPLNDSERRVLLGAALLSKKHDLQEYPYEGATPNSLRTMVWERPIQHTLRPARGGGFTGGFVMPYHALLEHLNGHPDRDPADFIAYAPDDARVQFSYGSEHVTHGAAAAALVAARNSLQRTAEVLAGPWDRYIEWIDDRLSRLWKLQGPAPGLGAVLSALHKGFNGTLFAMALADELELNADPWPVVDQILSGNRKVPLGSPAVTSMLSKRWKAVRADSSRVDVLKLLARIELTKEQAQRAMVVDPREVLANPYVLFERDRHELEPIAFSTVDRGLFPGDEVANAHPLPAGCSPALAEYDNEHRMRAACVQVLEAKTDDGHTFLPIGEAALATAELSVVQKIPLDAETVDICRDSFRPVVVVSGTGTGLAVQLDRYVDIGAMLSSAVQDRLRNAPKQVAIDWSALVNVAFGPVAAGDADEAQARKEKAVALDRVVASRISVLIGPAGTGKTTIIKFLLSRVDIVGRRVRLLAPTGKARVRLGAETGQTGNVQTVAQFLLKDRYDADTGRYFTNTQAPKLEATTCIVDESSMLTEDMLAAIVDALPETCRLVLVGDPYQLPPIGAGCPFVDIIEYLRRSHDGVGVAELRTPRRARQDGSNESVLARSDVQLAAIFSGRPLPPGEDEVVIAAIEGKDDETVKYRRWESTTQLPALIDAVIAEEWGCASSELPSQVELSLGASRNAKGYLNFEHGCSDKAADWQVLSVNRAGPGGSLFLNRRMKESLRGQRLKDTIDSAKTPHYRDWWRYPKPRGPEQIVYGDKVICVRNHRRGAYVYGTGTAEDKELLANGEIGIITGQRTWGRSAPGYTHVEFENRGDRSFSFSSRDFSEDGQPKLELAYAITVHKAQGSEFGTVILVLPARSRLVSREMLYTALTRQSKRIWILHQGPFENFLSLRQHMFSDIASRFTNLLGAVDFQPPRPSAEVAGALRGAQRTFLAEKLIHRTLRGEMVSSKNEVVIANILHGLEKEGHLRFQVEPRLPFEQATGRWADFLVESKGKVWYWEHCGRLDDENYRARWNRKLKLYEANGFEVYSEHTPQGQLIVTTDGPKEGLDSVAIEQLARKLFAS